MKTLRQLSATLFAATSVGLACLPAAAETWNFSATLGGGGTLSGWFSGEAGIDGVLSSFQGEVTGFHLSFSGQAGASPFEFGLDSLICGGGCALVWTVGMTTLGGFGSDGLYVDDGARFVTAGTAVAIDEFARVDSLDPAEAALRSLGPIAVSAVPEPAAALLLAAGLAGLALQRRATRRGPRLR